MRTFGLVLLATSIACVSCNINVCSDAKSGMFLQDFSDASCASYFVCMNGQAFESECTDGFMFNAESQTCDYPSEVNCDVCPSKAGVAVYNTVYPGLCGKYILCFGTTPVVRECAEGLQFDPISERCNEAKIVDCVANKCDSSDDINNIQYVSSASNCSNYFICYGGQPQKMSCGPNLYYNPETEKCDLPENYSCPISKTARTRAPYTKQPPQVARNVNCPKSKGVHFLPNPSDISSYIVCGEGRAYYMTCSYGLEYDSESEECRKPL